MQKSEEQSSLLGIVLPRRSLSYPKINANRGDADMLEKERLREIVKKCPKQKAACCAIVSDKGLDDREKC